MKNVEISLEKQLAIVVLKDGEKLDPATLRKAIKKADFTAGEMRMDAKGKVHLQKDAMPVFILPSTEQKFILQAAAKDGDKKTPFEMLVQAVAGGKSHFTISGIVHEQEKGDHLLIVEAFESLPLKERHDGADR